MSRQKHSAPSVAGLTTLSLLLILVACSDSPGKGNEPTATLTPTLSYDSDATPEPVYDVELAREKLASAKKRWESQGSADYDLDFLLLCLCPERNIPLKLTVRNGAIESVIDLNSGAVTVGGYGGVYTDKTINDWLDLLDAALGSRPAYHLQARYHPSLGYPTYINISYAYDVADYGFTLERLTYEPLDPSLPTAVPETS